jgi:hypothetical protein
MGAVFLISSIPSDSSGPGRGQLRHRWLDGATVEDVMAEVKRRDGPDVGWNEDEDGMYIAECPAIPGCVSQGYTVVRGTLRALIAKAGLNVDQFLAALKS